MVESRVMGVGQSLFIPRTDLGDAWFTAIRSAQDALPLVNRALTEIHRDITPFEEDTREKKIILYTGVEDIVSSVYVNSEIDTYGREVVASEILCRLSQLVISGVKSINALVSTLEIPNIGLVKMSLRPKTSFISYQHKSTALAMYKTLDVREGDAATWASDSFSFSSGQILNGGQKNIDLTGRARFLMHGPYIQLSTGTWNGELFFEFDSSSMSSSLVRFEWGNGHTFAHEDVELAEVGAYSLKLSFEWEAPAPAQFRLLLLRPVFHGTLNVSHCRVTFNHPRF